MRSDFIIKRVSEDQNHLIFRASADNKGLIPFIGIILAAGRGTRLGRNQNKSLVKVNGTELIKYAINFLKFIGAKQIIIITGYQADEVGGLMATVDSSVLVVKNEEWEKKGNLTSLLTAFKHTEESVLVMNVDHLYKRSLAKKASEYFNEQITVFCDFKEKIEPDERVVLLDENKNIKQIGKHLPKSDCATTGLTFIPAGKRGEYLSAVPETVRKLADAAGYEDVLQTAVEAGARVAMADVSGICPHEIDYPEELEKAEQGVKANFQDF